MRSLFRSCGLVGLVVLVVAGCVQTAGPGAEGDVVAGVLGHLAGVDVWVAPAVVDAGDPAGCSNPDFTSVGDAVAAAAAGETVAVCPGTYVGDVTVASGKGGLSIVSVTELEHRGQEPGAETEIHGRVQINSADVTFTGLTVRAAAGHGIRTAQSGVTIAWNTVTESVNQGVRVDGGSGGTVANNVIVGNGGAGVHLSGTGHVAKLNEIDGNGGAGVGLGGSGHEIRDNQINENDGRGIDGTSGSGYTVERNVIDQSGHRGIDLRGADNVVRGNVITNGSGAHDGVFLGSDLADNTVEGNTISGHGGTGLRITGTGHTVSGNTIADNGDHGIHATGSGHVYADNTISGNTNDGMDLRADGSTVTGGATISGNGRGLFIRAANVTIDSERICSNAVRDLHIHGDSVNTAILDSRFDTWLVSPSATGTTFVGNMPCEIDTGTTWGEGEPFRPRGDWSMFFVGDPANGVTTDLILGRDGPAIGTITVSQADDELEVTIVLTQPGAFLAHIDFHAAVDALALKDEVTNPAGSPRPGHFDHIFEGLFDWPTDGSTGHDFTIPNGDMRAFAAHVTVVMIPQDD